MAPLIFSNRIVNAMSWATDAPGGFTEADVRRHWPHSKPHRRIKDRGIRVNAESLGSIDTPGLSIFRNTGVREHNIELVLLPLDLCEQAIKIAKVRHVSLYARYISPDLLYRRC
jgi:hypothetical protein